MILLALRTTHCRYFIVLFVILGWGRRSCWLEVVTAVGVERRTSTEAGPAFGKC